MWTSIDTSLFRARGTIDDERGPGFKGSDPVINGILVTMVIVFFNMCGIENVAEFGFVMNEILQEIRQEFPSCFRDLRVG